MSAKVTVKTQIKDLVIFDKMVEEKGWTKSGARYHKGNKQFDLSLSKEGVAKIVYDDMNGIKKADVDTLVQAYATAVVVSEARKRGYTVKETGVDKLGNVTVEILC